MSELTKRCPMCGGSGTYTDIGMMYIKCKACNGTGKVDIELKSNYSINSEPKTEDQEVVIKKKGRPFGAKNKS